MRVLVDANLIISFLLKGTHSSGPVRELFDMAIRAELELVLPADLLTEVRNSVVRKRKLSTKIELRELDLLIERLGPNTSALPPFTGEIPKMSRDPKDDYLIAAAIVGDVDVLITGDKDLLVLRDLLERPRIMTPAGFLAEFGPSN